MARPLSDRTILVVEDEMLILMMIEDMLKDQGARVLPAATVAQALTLIEAAPFDAPPFDAAMLDMNLNGGDSYRIARLLAARGVPFLFSTGSSRHDLDEEFSDRPVLRKPFTYDQLAETLRRLLDPA